MNFAGSVYVVDAREIASRIEEIRRTPARRGELVELLSERSPIYQGLDTKTAERLRGYILASFESLGLPAAAMPFVLEELESGVEPYTVAAAAKALRGARDIPEQAPALLLRAVERLKGNDELVQYDRFRANEYVSEPTSALIELFGTITVLGAQAGALREALDRMMLSSSFSPQMRAAARQTREAISVAPAGGCCCSAAAGAITPHPEPEARPNDNIAELALQDQSGAVFPYRDFFFGRASVVTFFYTRCMNPEKCSLTITKLANLQRLIEREKLQSQINLAAFSYDPAFDRPELLHAYGHDRGMRFDDRNKLLRTKGSLQPLQERFDLGVGFGPATVNRHRIELLILDPAGDVTHRFTRAQWREKEVMHAAIEAGTENPGCRVGHRKKRHLC
jgi:protein SCO1/2